MSAYIRPVDLLDATTQLFGTSLGTQGVDFSQYTTDQMQSLISRASAQIDGFCKQTFALTNTQERYMGHGTNHLRLRRYPLAQIPDSVSGGAGPVSQSLVADTTFTANVAQGATSVAVADISNLLPGQYLQWADGTSEQGIEIAGVAPTAAGATSGPGTVTLKTATQYAHNTVTGSSLFPTPRLVVNTFDFIQIVLPGQSIFPIPIQQLVVDAEHGSVMNYTPLMFQQLGYATIFPNMLPLLARYTYGYLSGQYPAVLTEVCLEQCRRIALASANLAVAGVSSIKAGDASLSFAAWKPVTLGDDLKELLGQFRRNVGFV